MRTATVALVGLLAGLLAVTLLLTLDARRILLDTDAWTDSTAVVLEDDDTRAALVGVLMDASIERLTCESTIARLAVNTSVVQRALGRVSGKVDELLAGDRAQTLWRDANRSGHESFVRAARTDRPVGDDRLLEVGAMLDRAARVTRIAEVVLGDDEPEDDDGGDECGGGSSERLEVLDPGALHAAADLARTLHDARWLPTAIAVAMGACLLVILLVAGSLVRVGVGIAIAGLAAIAAAFAVRSLITGEAGLLVDGIERPATRELAEATIVAALAPTAEHLLWCVAGAGAVALVGGFLVVVGMRRRTRP